VVIYDPRDQLNKISLPQGCSMPNINAFRPVVYEKKIFITFSLFCPNRGQPLYLNKSESPSPKHVSPPSLVKTGKVLHEKTFKRFCYKTLLPCPKDVPCQISMHSGQWFMKRFFKINKIFLILPLIGPARHLNKSESPSPNHVSHQVWLKLAKWFVRRSCLKEKVNRRMDRRTPDKLRWQ